MRQKMSLRSLTSHGSVSHIHQLSSVDVDAEAGSRLLVFLLELGVVACSYVDEFTNPFKSAQHTRATGSVWLRLLWVHRRRLGSL